MELSEFDLSRLSDEDFNALFEEARKHCNSDILQDILYEIFKIMIDTQKKTH